VRPAEEGVGLSARLQASDAIQGDLTTFLRPKEAARVMRRSLKSFYRLTDEKTGDPTFPVTRLPSGTLLIPRLAFEQWLRDRTQGMRGPLRLAVSAPTSTAPQRTDGAGALKAGAQA
jgi:hypothetical protein